MTVQPAYLTMTAGTSRYLTQAAATNYYLTLNDPLPYDNDVALLLAEATWYIDSHQATSSQTVTNLGTAGTALNAVLGGGTAITTNDPRWLEYVPADGAYAYLPGVAGNYLSVPDSAPLDITGDIDVRVKVALDDWTPVSPNVLAAKSQATGQFSWRFDINTTGVVRFIWSVDGTALTTVSSTVATAVSDGATKWVRATLDVDNGAAGNDVKFYLSDDGVTWTQLGTTVTSGGATSIFSSTSVLEVGGRALGSTQLVSGKVYRAIIKDGIDGTTVLDVDTSVLTSGSQTTFTATTGQTVTVNRSTSGRKTTLVGGWAGGGSLWLLGTDDYLSTPDGDAIDFAAADSFTVLAVFRNWATQSSFGRILAKRNGGTGPHYLLLNNSTMAGRAYMSISDGTTSRDTSGLSGTYTQGSLAVVTGVRDTSADTIVHYNNATIAGTPQTDTTTGSLANAGPLTIGAENGGSFNDMEFQAAAIWRRALTAGEIAGLNRYFQNRAYND